MSPGEFLKRRKQFRLVDPVIVETALEEAAIRMGGPDVSMWGSFAAAGQPMTFADIAQMRLATHLLTVAPNGRATVLDGETEQTGETADLREFNRMMEAVAGGFTVSGGTGPIRRC